MTLEKLLVPATSPSGTLEIAVIFTSVDATLAALKKAGNLASDLRARITLLVPYVVPYPLPLSDPQVSPEFHARRFQVLANDRPVETSVHLYLCRDRLEALKSVLKAQSLVVIGGQRRWWRLTSEQILAKRLMRAGHEVVFVGME